MSNKDLTLPLIAGLLASGLFIVVFSSGLGFIFMFLPTLPVFALGLHRLPHAALNAVFIASGIIAGIAGVPVALLFLIFFGLPAWYIVRQSLRWRLAEDGKTHEWLPVGLIFTHLTLCACALVALVTLYYTGHEGGLPAVLSQNIHKAFADLQEDYGDVIDMLAGDWSFLIFSMTVWLWCLALYAHAWVANRALIRKGLQLRPDFTLDVFPMPNWMLSLLAICALASLIGSDSMRFLGQSTLISLMLPYFLLGSAVLRQASQKWPSRRFFLFFIFFMVFAQFWPALAIAGVGLWHHIKHLSAGGTSYKS